MAVKIAASQDKDHEDEEKLPAEDPGSPSSAGPSFFAGRFSRSAEAKAARASQKASQKQDKEDKVRKKAARKFLLGVIKEAPDVYVALGLNNKASDKELLKALFDAEEPREIMLRAGVSTKDAAKAVHVWKDALHDSSPIGGTHSKRCVSVKTSTAFGFLFAGVLFLAASMLSALFGKMGWKVGDCKVSGYFNLTFGADCNALTKCSFDVDVREESKWYLMSDWYPALTRKDDRLILAQDAFKCCNLGETLNCCDWYDPKVQRFCDNWPHRDAADGSFCPDDVWPCLFKTTSESGSEDAEDATVSELKADYEQPEVMTFMIAAMSFFALGLLILLSNIWIRVLVICFVKCLEVTRISGKGEVGALRQLELDRKNSISTIIKQPVKKKAIVADSSFEDAVQEAKQRDEEAQVDVEQPVALPGLMPSTDDIEEIDAGNTKDKKDKGKNKKDAANDGNTPKSFLTELNTPEGGDMSLGAGADDFEETPVLSLKEIAKQATFVWMTPIIEHHPNPRPATSPSSGGSRSPTSPMRPVSGKSRRGGGMQTPSSAGTLRSDRSPSLAWNFAMDSSQAGSNDSLRQTADTFDKPFGGRAQSAGRGRRPDTSSDMSPSSRPKSATSRPSHSGRPRSASATGGRPRSATVNRPISASARRRDIISASPDWAANH